MRDYTMQFSHMGIYVADLEKMIDFYSRLLGFPVTDRGLLRGETPIAFLSRDPCEHHQIALIADKADANRARIIHQISFRLPDLETLQRLWRRLKQERVVVEGETAHRTITHGNAWAIYVHDPEGNQLELFVDSPWYIEQPCSLHIDLDRPAADIIAESEAFCRAQPGFKPVEDWRDDMRRKIAAHDAA